MGSFNYGEIFGSGSSVQTADYTPLSLTIDTGDLLEVSQSGDLPDGIGLSNASSPTATQIFYGLILLLLENQASAINDDPTQKIYVADAGKSIATGTRDGQIKRSFTVSFFIDAGLAGTPSIDQIDR
jgi:hypothetical protein